MSERPQPPVFLWTHGHFLDTSKSETFNHPTRGPELFLALSYCGQDAERFPQKALDTL